MARSLIVPDLNMLALRQETRNQEWIQYHDGRRFSVETQKSPILNKNADVIGLIGICRPIAKVN